MSERQYLAEFAERLREAVEEAGYRANEQTALGNLFSVSGQAARKWLNGESMPSATRAQELADILKVRRSWLLHGDLPKRDGGEATLKVRGRGGKYRFEPFSISNAEKNLLVRFRHLPSGVQQAVSKLVDSLEDAKAQK